MLGPNEKPAAILRLRMEQAGYAVEDGMHLLNPDNLHILLRFVYKAQVLAGVRIPNTYTVFIWMLIVQLLGGKHKP